MSDSRLPTHLWVDAHLQKLNADGRGYYIHKTGEKMSGMILLKINGLAGECRLLTQQRNLEGELGWMNALNEEMVAEDKADQYIQRATQRDPDLWIIEVEDRELANPFEGKMI